MTTLHTYADTAKKILTRSGASAFSITAGQSRSVETEWRAGTLDRVQDKTHRSLGVEIYADGKYAGFSTNDLRQTALEAFLIRAVEMTRLLEPDPCRSLPNCPIGLPSMDLDSFDESIHERRASDRLFEMRRLNDALESVIKNTTYASYSTSLNDGWGH